MFESGTTITAMPPLIVLPRARVEGIDARDENGLLTRRKRRPDTFSAASVVPFQEAMEHVWSTDAHYAGYLPSPFVEDEVLYRYNKPFLSYMREAKRDLVFNYASVDLDTPGHVFWTLELMETFLDLLTATKARGGPFAARLAQACYAHSTLKGFRWIFRFYPAPPVDEAEGRIRGLIHEFKGAGFEPFVVDELADWTRLMRLPRVERPFDAPEVVVDDGGSQENDA